MKGIGKWWWPVLFFAFLAALMVVFFWRPVPFDPGPRSVRSEAFFLSFQSHPQVLVFNKELPPPCELAQLQESMEFYATNACGNCHRLLGFEGNVELEETFVPWFTSLFPAEMTGKQCLSTLNASLDLLDKRLKRIEEKEPSILEKLQKKDQELLLSFYPAFSYARQKKMGQFESEKSSQEEQTHWMDVFERTLFAYIQTYGLGRLIAPPLHWSGIYRSESWLMGHFKDPAFYVPGTYMPAFPFSDEQFWGLTKMLVALGIKNRDALQQQWQKNGFDPQGAYQACCAACHGSDLQGNGPVAKRLYPLVKSLKNVAYMLGVTPEGACLAISHGVGGTSMPPWEDSFVPDRRPVLTDPQINQLVSWLYTGLPGISRAGAIPQYGIQEVTKEFNREKVLPGGVANFDQRTIDGHIRYFLKPVLYTKENLQAGEKLYQTQCAVCHGVVGDGRGPRAEAMESSKPQKLTNVAWINSVDDIQLLKGIKYGVPGTAMSSWGDDTSALQRVQMVLYIRSLSSGKEIRFDLDRLIIQNFVRSQDAIDRLRCSLIQKGASQETVALTDQINQKAQEEEHLYLQLAKGVQDSLETPCIKKFMLLLEAHGPIFSWQEGNGIVAFDRQKEISESFQECIEVATDPKLQNLLKEGEKVSQELHRAQLSLYHQLQTELTQPAQPKSQLVPPTKRSWKPAAWIRFFLKEGL